jgi:hypothetical protein
MQSLPLPVHFNLDTYISITNPTSGSIVIIARGLKETSTLLASGVGDGVHTSKHSRSGQRTLAAPDMLQSLWDRPQGFVSERGIGMHRKAAERQKTRQITRSKGEELSAALTVAETR